MLQFGCSQLVFFFPSLPSLYHFFGVCSKCTNYNRYDRHLHVPCFFLSSRAISSCLSRFTISFIFTLWPAGTAKSTICQILMFCWLLLGLVVWPRLGVHLHLKILNVSLILLDRFRTVLWSLVRMIKWNIFTQFPVDYLLLLVVSNHVIF